MRGPTLHVLERWTMGVIRARYVVVAVWLLAALLGLLSSSALSSRLTTPLSIPGTDSDRADQLLTRHFGENVAGSFTVVVPLGRLGPGHLARDEAAIGVAAQRVPTARVTQARALLGLLFADVDTSLDLSRASGETDALRTALAAAGLRGALVTGPPALQHDLTPILSHDLRRGELVAIGLAILLLVLTLGLSGAVLVPLVVAAATIAVDIGAVFVLSLWIPMVLYTPNVIELIGLGLAMDYSLLVVHRFRREAADGADQTGAIRATMLTAGRTVVASSAVVAVGLVVLACVPVPFLRSLGTAGLVVPVVALLAALTLQPALLALLGRHVTRGAAPMGRRRRDLVGGGWARVGAAVVARPVRTLAGAIAVLGLAGVSVAWLQLTPASTSAIPASLPSARALNLLSDRIGPGVVTPVQIVVDLGRPRRATTPAIRAATLRLGRLILPDPEVFAVAIGAKAPFVDPTGRYERLLVFGRDELGAEASQQLVHRLRAADVPRSSFGAGTHIYVGGAPAQGVDFLDAVYGAAPWIVLAALVLALLVLARAFRSLVLAAVSVGLNLVTVTASLGLLVLCTRFGVGRVLLGTYEVAQVEGWVPVFLFAVLFGLSMDYEVFLVARMREAYDSGASNNEAIVAGLARTGGVITAAAGILIAAVSGLVFGRVAGLQELGTGLGLGILVDATVVRGLLLPSVMALLGPWNWWLPERVARLLHTRASPLERRGARPGATVSVPTGPR